MTENRTVISEVIHVSYHRARRFVIRNQLTPMFAVFLVGVAVIQLYVAAASEQLFAFLFVAQLQITPALLLAPFAHGSFQHLAVNTALLLLYGWPTENLLETREFAVFFVGVAALSTYAQVVFDALVRGSAGTLGASGAVYAFPAFYAIVAGARVWRSNDSIFDHSLVLSALVVTALIPLLMFGIVSPGLEIDRVAPPAAITHAVGYLVGLTYGAHRA